MTLSLALAAPLTVALPASAEEAPAAPLVRQENTSDEATALAEAADTGQPVEVLSQRTEASQTFANPDGGFTEDTYAAPQWVRKDNKLVDIDTALVTNDDGTLSPKATEIGVRFSGGGTGALATVTRDGRSMSVGWPGTLPKPTVDNDTVTYAEVLDGVDLKLKVHSGGYNQVLVVKTAEAAKNPELAELNFDLDTKGLEVTADEHGNVRARNPAGQEVFTAPTPRMWDSSKPAAQPLARSFATTTPAGPPATDEFEPGFGARDAAMDVELGEKSLALTPDAELLTGKNTRYPVYIDPSVDGSRHSWSIAYKKHPDSTFFNGAGFSGGTSTARAGYENYTDGLARSYFRMNTKNLQDKNRVISSSRFRIKNTWSWSCDSRSIELWHTEYLKSSHTWNDQPAKKETLDTVNDSKGWSSSCPAGNLAFDTTRAAKESQAGTWATLTLALKATNETDVYAWKKFDAHSAVLSTTYNTRPAAPSGLDTSPSTRNAKGCGDVAPYGLIGNTDISLTAKGSDKDGGTVKVKFHLWPTGHHASGVVIDKTVSVTSGTVARLKVTKAELSPHIKTASGNFSWKAQTNDGSLYSDWTPTEGSPGCRFVYDPNRPSNPPGVTSSQFPDGDEGWPVITGSVRTEGTFVLSSGGVSDVVRYEYWTDWDGTRRTATPPTAGWSTSVKLTPTATGSNQVYVKSYDKANNASDTAVYVFYANGPKTRDKAGDLNGDGNADLWAIDKDGTLRRFYGAGDGTVAQAADTASGAIWSGDKITHRGDWNNDAYEDLVALRKDPALGTSRLWMHPNSGWGFACTDCTEFDRQELTVYDSANNHWKDGVKQILAIGDVDGGMDVDGDGTQDVEGHPDLLVNDGKFIWLYYGNLDHRLDSDRDPVLLAGPDDPIAGGISTVNEATLAAPGDYNGDGRVDLVVRYDRPDVASLYVFHGGETEGGYDINLNDRTPLSGSYNWSAASVPMFTAAPDANSNGKFDLWATTPSSGRIRFFGDYTAAGHTTLTTASEAFLGYQSIG
ncbi:VCBS repeat-containing protein [Streptomyces agglomeratus]|uniref:VCBS repeat-containing protein n=1 Tax=Streptomyces agglomeratus TaxID=285458 RepID=UPI0019D23840|nr:VCBS repeat-containing protein [Streptomyces agglomeratus]